MALNSTPVMLTRWCLVTDLVIPEVSSQTMDSVTLQCSPWAHLSPHGTPHTLNGNAEKKTLFFQNITLLYICIYTHTPHSLYRSWKNAKQGWPTNYFRFPKTPSSSLPASFPRFTPNHNPELTALSDIAIKGVNENKEEIFLNSVQCQKKSLKI